MRLHRIIMSHYTHMLGDCACGHSIIYHVPIAGCMKCDCDEFH